MSARSDLWILIKKILKNNKQRPCLKGHLICKVNKNKCMFMHKSVLQIEKHALKNNNIICNINELANSACDRTCPS